LNERGRKDPDRKRGTCRETREKSGERKNTSPIDSLNVGSTPGKMWRKVREKRSKHEKGGAPKKDK